VFDSARVGDVDAAGNQSIYGAVARITHSRVTTPAETALIAAVAVGGLACSVLAARRLGDSWGVAACSVTALLVAPIAWSHHWVWVVPVSLLLWQHARVWLVPVPAIFLSQLIWTVPHGAAANELAFSAAQVAVSCSYTAAGVAFLVAVAVRASRAPRAGTAATGSGQDRMGEPTARDADGSFGRLSTPSRSAGGVHP
jgi:alpha-1,2-mannosyltransferase